MRTIAQPLQAGVVPGDGGHRIDLERRGPVRGGGGCNAAGIRARREGLAA
jgi:hypothetical protein